MQLGLGSIGVPQMQHMALTDVSVNIYEKILIPPIRYKITRHKNDYFAHPGNYT